MSETTGGNMTEKDRAAGSKQRFSTKQKIPSELYANNPLVEVPRTWRTTYMFAQMRLSPTMIKALQESADARLVSASKRTKLALATRHLCDDEGWLIEEGQVAALAASPLHKQCRLLKIPLENTELHYEGPSELAAMDFLTSHGGKASYCEGGIMKLILYCLCFHKVYGIAKKMFGDPSSARPYMYTGLPYEYLIRHDPHVAEKLVEEIRKGNEATLLQGFQTLKRWQGHDGWAFKNWMGVERGIILDVYRSLKNDQILGLASYLFSDYYAFNRGWPDLVWVADNILRLYEVKTTDKLLFTQIVTISELLRFGFDIRVLKVARQQKDLT